jgi:hypothetical protein
MDSKRLAGVVVGLLAIAGLSLGLAPVVAGASSGPPPLVTRSPQSRSVAVGHSVTFLAAAKYASTAVWQESTDGGSMWTLVGGVNTFTKKSLRTAYTIQTVTAAESGWEFRAVFVNDPSGVPSGIQTSGTAAAVLTVK